jgi:hypothetical protein
MTLILAAHGTRKPAGVAMIGDLAARVGELVGRPHAGLARLIANRFRRAMPGLAPAATLHTSRRPGRRRAQGTHGLPNSAAHSSFQAMSAGGRADTRGA